jgi:hypothetical protein
MTATDKRSLISESVMVNRIGVHPAGEEPNQYVVRVTPRVSHMTTVREFSTKSKSGLCSWDEVLAPSDCPNGCHPGLPHSLSNKLPQSREGQFDKVVTRLLGLPGPINPTCGQYKSKLTIGAKMMRSLIDTGWGYYFGTSE